MPAVVFVTTLEPQDGRRDELVGLLAELAKHIRGEPGFMQYSVYRPLGGDSGPLLVIQMYASVEAYQEHNSWVRGQIPRISALLVAPRPSCPIRTGPARRRRGEGAPFRKMIMPCGVPEHLR
jgi:quinol monooxygenase YgiN